MGTFLYSPFLTNLMPKCWSTILRTSISTNYIYASLYNPGTLNGRKDNVNKYFSTSYVVPETQTWFNSVLNHDGKKLLKTYRGGQQITIHRCMAGHSKWQNIRHIKGAKDAEKSKTFSKFTQLIRAAVRDGGNSDIKLNQKLAVVVQQAKQKNMPVATIEAAIKKTLGSKDKLEQFIMEVKGPGNCFIIISSLSDNVIRTKHQIKSIINKVSAQVLDSGSTKNFFDYKGVLNVEKSDNITLEKALDDAIEVGAEEVLETEDEDGNVVLQFLSDPKDFYVVKKRLEELNYNISFAGLEFLAHTKTSLNDSDLERAARLLDMLEDHPEVVKVFDNIA